jgi:HPt (histidine-containing phosphotransfer) domain-containing protein
MRSAHVIKGAAANLMCGQLRAAAQKLEQAARVAHEAGGTTAPPDLQAAVQGFFAELQLAGTNYLNFLVTSGI